MLLSAFVLASFCDIQQNRAVLFSVSAQFVGDTAAAVMPKPLAGNEPLPVTAVLFGDLPSLEQLRYD